MKIYGHCRFSYFGQSDTGREVLTLEDAQAKLWNAQRMAVRFHLFERITLPSIRHQTDPDFTFVVTTSNEMPDAYQARLDALVADLPQVRVLRTSERRIRRALLPVMREASDDHSVPACHFRLDDDDAVSGDYVARLRAVAPHLPMDSAVSFGRGVMGYTDEGTARHVPFQKNGIAIGFALVKAPGGDRSPFAVQHIRYIAENPVFLDPTFPAYHYTRHSTNNTNGYDRAIHREGGVVEVIARNARKGRPEIAEGAVTTEAAEDAIAQAFPWTDGPRLRAAIAATLTPEALPPH